MAKTLWLTTAEGTYGRGDVITRMDGATSWQNCRYLSEARGNSPTSTANTSTVTGPTSGVDAVLANGRPIEFISEPLSADFTIAGTINCNIWAAENNLSANVAINLTVDKIDGATGNLTRIATTTNTVELGTTASANVFSVTPTSTACKHGDRLRVRIFGDDAGTMATGFTFFFRYAGFTVGASGDSWIQFTEDLTFDIYGDPGTRDQTLVAQTVAVGTVNNQTVVSQPFVSVGDFFNGGRAWLAITGAPTDSIVVTLETDSGGNPSGTSLLTIATYPASALTTTLSRKTWTGFNLPITAGATYHITFRRTGALDDNNYYRLNAGNVSGGAGLIDARMYLGGAWVSLGAPLTSTVYNLPAPFYLSDTQLTAITVPVAIEEPRNEVTAGVGTATAQTRMGQQFVAVSNSITDYTIQLQKIGAPADSFICELWTDSAGSPGSLIQQLSSTAASSISASLTAYIFSSGGPWSVTAGNTYWLVFRRSGANDAANYIQYRATTVSASLGASKDFDGSVWSAAIANKTMTLKVNFTANPKAAIPVRGNSVATSVTNTRGAGPVPPLPITTIVSGYQLQWFSPPMNAFTLGGKAKFNIRALESNALANASLRAELAICNGDGSNPVVWGVAGIENSSGYGDFGEIGLADDWFYAWPSGDDTAVTSGQRLRFRIFIDDATSGLASGYTCTVSYNGPTVNAAGDTFVLLPAAATYQGAQTRFGTSFVTLTDNISTNGRVPQTFNGTSVVTLTDVIASAGTRRVNGVGAVSLTAAISTSGVAKKIGQSVVALTGAITTIGQRKRFAQSVISLTDSIATAAVRKTFGVSTVPLTDTITTQGRRQRLAQSVVTLTDSITTTGQRKTFSTSVVPLIDSITTASKRTTKGTSVAAFTATITTNGKSAVKLGASVAVLTDSITTTGGRRAFGVNSAPFVIAITTAGKVYSRTFSVSAFVVTISSNGVKAGTKVGTSVVTLTDSISTAGKRTVKNTSAASFNNSITTLGVRKTFSTSVASFTDSITTSGRRTRFGQNVAAFSFVAVTTGLRKTFASSVVALANAITTLSKRSTKTSSVVALSDAITSNGQVTGSLKTGTSVVSLTSAITTAGKRTVFASSVASFTDTITTLSKRSTKATSVAAFIAGITTLGIRKIYSASAASFAVNITTAVRLTRKGQSAVDLSFLAVTSGSRKTFGVNVVAFTDVIVTASRRSTKSTSVTPLTALISTNGAITSGLRVGVSVVSLTDTITTTGKRKTFGGNTVSLSNTITTVGQRTTFTVSSMTLVDSITTLSKRKAIAASAVSLTDSISTIGRRKVYAVSAVSLIDSITTTGKCKLNAISTTALTVNILSNAVKAGTKLGTSVIQLTDTIASTGQRRALAQSAVVLTNTVTTAVIRKTFAVSTAAFADTVATYAVRQRLGTTSAPFVFTAITDSKRNSIGASTVSLTVAITTARNKLWAYTGVRVNLTDFITTNGSFVSNIHDEWLIAVFVDDPVLISVNGGQASTNGHASVDQYAETEVRTALWGTDYPHWDALDAVWGGTMTEIHEDWLIGVAASQPKLIAVGQPQNGKVVTVTPDTTPVLVSVIER